MAEETKQEKKKETTALVAKKSNLPAPRTREQEEKSYILVRNFFAIIVHLLYGIKTLHTERLPEGACIVCPNHTSNLDPPALATGFKKTAYLRFMAKKSLLEIPIIGGFISRAGSFGVDRGNNDVGAIKKALKVLKDGCKLVMFPEGTRVKNGAEGDAKAGAVMLAMKTGVPIVPVFMTREKKLFHKIVMVVGEPYTLKPAGKRATKEELETAADDLLKRIYALEEETK